ncbi:hypothetical protein [Streptomyces sp. NPDC051576]|uniref:hypothetical protein n=1 Tax=Streptomyces sp. NPDC051576 TaxID=3155803 RepID=UPI00344AD32A
MREPTLCFDSRGRHEEVPNVIYRLRQEYLGALDDDAFPHVLAEVRADVPEADLRTVPAAAFGRNPDGTAVDHV